MTFTLYLDEQSWNAQQDRLLAELPGIVPVVKGNGYGLGRRRLARQCRRLGVPCMAVGTPGEVHDARAEYPGDVLVLQPLGRDRVPAAVAQATDKPWLLRTVAHLDVLARLASLAARGRTIPRVVVELDTPVHRHGISWNDAADLRDLRDLLAHVPHEGIALHLPIEGPRETVAHEVLDRLTSARIDPKTLWVSHLGKREVQGLTARVDIPVRPRIGTLLWHGDRSA
jgi:alanine racemase